MHFGILHQSQYQNTKYNNDVFTLGDQVYKTDINRNVYHYLFLLRPDYD